MGILSKLFQGRKSPEPKLPEHAVIVHFHYGSTDLDPLFKLEDRLEKAIEEASAGELDGNEIAMDGSDGYLYMYGPDADKLFFVVHPILKQAQFMKGAVAMLRYGPPEDGVRETAIEVDA